MTTASQSTFLFADGTPLAGGTVEIYAAGTSTQKTSYSDSALTTPNTWPVTLDANGKASIWISGSYRIVVKDSNGVVRESQDNRYGLGSDTLNFIDGVVGVAKTYAVDFDILNGDDIIFSGSGKTATGPATASAGHRYQISNYGSNALSLDSNGMKINGSVGTISIPAGEKWEFKYADTTVDATTGWVARKIASIDGSGGGGGESPHSRVTGLVNAGVAQTRYTLDGRSAAATLQLPSGSADGAWVIAFAIGANACKVEPSGVDTIDGLSELTIEQQTEMKFVYVLDETKWYPVSRL